MRSLRLLAALLVTFSADSSPAQDLPSYSFHHSFSVFTEYADTSSHIILGVARNRRQTSVGFAFTQRLRHTRYADWYYTPEILPLVMIQQPIATQTLLVLGYTYSQTQPATLVCAPAVVNMPANIATGSPAYTYTKTCATRWSYAGGLSPLGQRLNLAPRSRLQPFIAINAGFLVSPHDLPVNDSSRFNFTFEFGGGIEFFRDHRHSWSAEYRIHHISNAFTGDYNPGVDNQIIRLTYTLGR